MVLDAHVSARRAYVGEGDSNTSSDIEESRDVTLHISQPALRQQFASTSADDEHDKLFDVSEITPGAIFAADLVKSGNGFGFNIVGGTDDQHLPRHDGIFVSVVSEGGPAAVDGRIKQGDRIISVNGKELAAVTHDEAVQVFRDISIGGSAMLIVESKADMRISMEQILTRSQFEDDEVEFDVDIPAAGLLTPSLKRAVNAWERHRLDDREREDDEDSVASYAPSQHSIIDDVPRTPKKPMSILDPRNNSIFTEVLYVSIGLAVITGACMVGYRMYTRGRQ